VNDRLYGGPGNDTLTGWMGAADHFDCGLGIDVDTDYKSLEGDTVVNCEIMN
jgi:hypothetical protein